MIDRKFKCLIMISVINKINQSNGFVIFISTYYFVEECRHIFYLKPNTNNKAVFFQQDCS